MGRRIKLNKPMLISIHITQDSHEIIKGYMKSNEITYETVQRILDGYVQLRDRVDELEFVNSDLLDTLNITRAKIMKLETFCGK